MTEPTQENKPAPAWDALVEEMSRQFCELHHMRKRDHDPELHLAQLTAFLGGLMMGIDFQKQYAYDAELLLAEYREQAGALPGLDTEPNVIEDEALVLSRLVRQAIMGDPDGR